MNAECIVSALLDALDPREVIRGGAPKWRYVPLKHVPAAWDVLTYKGELFVGTVVKVGDKYALGVVGRHNGSQNMNRYDTRDQASEALWQEYQSRHKQEEAIDPREVLHHTIQWKFTRSPYDEQQILVSYTGGNEEDDLYFGSIYMQPNGTFKPSTYHVNGETDRLPPELRVPRPTKEQAAAVISNFIKRKLGEAIDPREVAKRGLEVGFQFRPSREKQALRVYRFLNGNYTHIGFIWKNPEGWLTWTLVKPTTGSPVSYPDPYPRCPTKEEAAKALWERYKLKFLQGS